MTNNLHPTIAITGGGGFLGSVLVTHFSKKGWNVLALVRNASNYSALDGVKYVEYDLRKPLRNSAFFKGVDYLVHAAYIKQDQKNPQSFEANIEGAKRLLKVSHAMMVKKNIFISSMSAHSGAVSVYGKQKLVIEKLFNTDSDVSLRLGLIIGGGGIVQNMAHFMKSKHLVPLIGGGVQPLQIVNVDQIGEVIEHVISKDLDSVLTIANPQVYSYKEFYTVLSKHLGIHVVFVPVPFFILQFIFRLTNIFHLPLGINEDNLLGLKKLTSVDTSLDLKQVGVILDDLKTSLESSHLL